MIKSLGGGGGGGGGGAPAYKALYPTMLGSGTTDDYAPAGFDATITDLFLTGNTFGCTLAGLIAIPHMAFRLINLGNNIVMPDHAGSSLAANQWGNKSAGQLTLVQFAAIFVTYDSTNGCWRPMQF